MNTYSLNTDIAQVEAVVAQLTAKGRETMRAVGNYETSFFDDGITEHSGIWGECLVSELGHKSSGVVNRLRDLGLWTVSPGDSDDNSMWWALTALGADVANFLAGRLDFQAASERIGLKDVKPGPTVNAEDREPTTKVGRKWTYMYDADGNLIAELSNANLELVGAYLRARGLA